MLTCSNNYLTITKAKRPTVFDLISENALISGPPIFLRSCHNYKRSKKIIVQSRFAITRSVMTLIGCNAVMCYICSSYFNCFNYIMSCPATQFNLLMWHFCYTVHVFLYIYIEQLCLMFVMAITIATALRS